MNATRLYLYLILSLIINISCDVDDNRSMIQGLDCGSDSICIEVYCTDKPDNSTACLNDLLADGLTTLRIVATVPQDIDEAYKEVTFETSTGSFPGEVNPAAPKIAAINGKAEAFLTVGTSPGPQKVKASVKVDDVPFPAVFPFELRRITEPVISFELDDMPPDLFVAEANNTQIVKITTRINGVAVKGKKVKLSINGEWAFEDHPNGEYEFVFQNNPVIVCYAKVSQNPGECFLRADFEGVSEPLNFTSERAVAEAHDLIITPPSIKFVNGSVKVKSYLTRLEGLVSLHTKVDYCATQTTTMGTIPVGFFDPPFGRSDSNELAEVSFFTTGDSSMVIPGIPIMIKACLVDGSAPCETRELQPIE